jgi:hypothetical protein
VYSPRKLLLARLGRLVLVFDSKDKAPNFSEIRELIASGDASFVLMVSGRVFAFGPDISGPLLEKLEQIHREALEARRKPN